MTEARQLARVGAAAVAVVLSGATIFTQGEARPVNDGPNPYTVVLDWAKVPAPRTFGSTAGIYVDKDGKSIWVADRCGDKPGGGFGGDGCAQTPDVAPIMKFDSTGKMVTSFGAGMFIFPHGMYVDPDGNIWVTDQRNANANELAKVPGAKALGSRAIKFSPDGKVLLVLGKGGVAGNPPEALTEPLDVVVGRNGDIFLSEGHCGQNADPGPNCVARIDKFDKNGKFIKSWGKMGTGPGEFKTPHALALDSKGRLVVADRGTTGCRSSIRTGSSSSRSPSSAAPATCTSTGTTWSTRSTQSRTTRIIRAGRRACASAACTTTRSPPSCRATRSRPAPARPAKG